MADDETPTYKVTEDGIVLVGLKLAHPLAQAYAQRAHAEDIRDYKVGEELYVSRDWGNALIDAGMVQIDPTDAEARQAALLLNRRNAPLTVKEIAAKYPDAGGESDAKVEPGDADAATGAGTEAKQSAASKSAAPAKK